MKKNIFSLILLLTFLNIYSQSKVIYQNDTIHLNKIILDSITDNGNWEFKDELPKGRYVLVKETKCGIDSILSAEFNELKQKHGTWIKWFGGECIGSKTNESDNDYQYSFIFKHKKKSETEYDNGFIVSRTNYHISSNFKHIWYGFPKNSTQMNEWDNQKVWDESGKLRWEIKPVGNLVVQQIDYYSTGEIESIGNFEKDGTFKDAWSYYYKNGQLKGSGEFEPIQLRYYAGYRMPIGKWSFWDKEGELIAELIFQNGKVIKTKKYQEKDIPIHEINEMVNK